DHARRVLDWHAKRHRLPWQEIVPQRLKSHVEGPLPHATTVSDDFNRADEDPITGWTIFGDNTDWTIRVISNQMRIDNEFRAPWGYFNTPLSGSDQVVAVTTQDHNGPAGRMSGTSTRSFYSGQLRQAGFTNNLVKYVSSTLTVLDTHTSSGLG